jgi:tetratricopeptide (TPR) repeat protein
MTPSRVDHGLEVRVGGTTRVFVSYRRQDARHVAGRLADRLVERFQVFMDMDTIEPGTDFTDVIRQAVEDCDVFLSVIGAQWLSVKDDQGQPRLEDASDWVVAETVAALHRNVPVIPVLVDGAVMPSRSELPAELAALASRQAMTIRHESFSSDVNRLIAAIERRVDKAAEPASPPPAAPVSPPPVAPAAVDAEYSAALAAFFARRWDEAIERFERVLRVQPQHTAATERLAEARRNRQLAIWSDQADRAAAEGRWSDVVIQLENIRSLDPNFPDLTRRLQVATAKRRAADLQSDIRTLATAGQWAAVVAAGQELARLDPGRADPDGLVARAQTELGEAQRRRLADLYNRAGQAEAAGRLDEAVDALSQLTQLDPGNTDAARRLQLLRERRAGRGSPVPGPPPGSAPTPPPISSPTPPPMPPDGPGATPVYFAPPPDRRRSRNWIIAAVAVVLAAVVAIGVLIFRDALIGPAGPTLAPTPSGLTASPSPSPVTPSPTVSPSPDGTPGLTTSELRTHIPRDIRATCKDYVPPSGDPLEVKLVGALRCEPTESDSPNQVWYFEYTDNAAMDAAYAPYTKGTFVKGDCKAKGQKMDFTTTEQGKKLPGGVLHCYESENGDTYFAWTHDFLHIMSFAGDPDLSFAKMKAWWEHAGPYRQV